MDEFDEFDELGELDESGELDQLGEFDELGKRRWENLHAEADHIFFLGGAAQQPTLRLSILFAITYILCPCLLYTSPSPRDRG